MIRGCFYKLQRDKTLRESTEIGTRLFIHREWGPPVKDQETEA
jgi:hypothetical protein